MEYYSAMKNKAVLPFAAAQMDLEGIRQGVSQIEESKYSRPAF